MLGLLFRVSGKKQAEVAQRLGTNQSNLSKWINGVHLPQRKFHVPLFEEFKEFGLRYPADVWAPLDPSGDVHATELMLRYAMLNPARKEVILTMVRELTGYDPEPPPQEEPKPSSRSKPKRSA